MAKVFCFGNTSNGELGLGGIEDEHILLPRRQKLVVDRQQYGLRQLSSGRNHTLVLFRNHFDDKTLVLSCGSNDRNQLGREGSWKRFETIDVLNNHVVIRLCCGSNHSLVLTECGQIFGWGCNLFGQLGIGNKMDESVGKPSLVKRLAAEMVVQIACGGNHSLALTKRGLLYSWGSNAFGQLGNGRKGNCENSPIEVINLSSVPIRVLSCGGSHSCVLSYTGALYMWGKNEFGQLGLNDVNNRVLPTLQTTLRTQRIQFIDCGEEHTVALTTDGGLFSWGAGMYGQLGHAKNNNEILPRRVFELMGNVVTQVSCGRCHTLVAVGPKGRVYSFGLNGSGQLGIGTQVSKSVPINVTGKWVELGVRDVSLRKMAGSLLPVINDGSDRQSADSSPKSPRKSRSPAKHVNHDIDVNDDEMSIDELSDSEDNIDGTDLTDSHQSVIIEEPEDLIKEIKTDRKPSFVCTSNTIVSTEPESIEIDEYLSDPDSESGLNTERSHLVLKEVIASKGDQSFVIVGRLTDKSKPLDLRFDNQFEEIYKLDNKWLELLNETLEEQTIPFDGIDYVENALTSISCWNSSFIDYESNSDSILPSIDWISAKKGFDLIEKSKNSRIKELIFQSILKIIPNLPNIFDQNSLDPEVLRIHLLLPLFHMFRSDYKNPEVMRRLIGGYFRAVLKLSDFAINAFNEWLSRLDINIYKLLIETNKNCIIELLGIQDKQNQTQEQNRSQQIDSTLHENLGLSLEFMALLHKINKKFHKISYKEFYIKGIADKFDLKMDYIYWLSSRAKNMHRTGGQKSLYLCDFPFIFDPPAKTQILATDSAIQQQNAAESSIYRSLVPIPMFMGGGVLMANPYFVLSVTRNSILQETINQLCFRNQNPSEFKKPLKVNFENEEAIDAGIGMKKEFFLLLMKEILDPKYGMFNEYKEMNTIWFNPGEVEDKNDLVMYHLIGIICGLAIYNQVIIYLPFPLVLYKKLLSEPLDLEDLNSLDPILVKNLKDILRPTYTEEEFNAIYSDLNFTITLTCFGSAVEFELEKEGKNKTLNYLNRKDYVNLYWIHILNKSVEQQFDSFKSGFNKVLDSGILELFHAQELMQLVTGQEVYDWKALQMSATEYKPPFSDLHPTIVKFWNVFHSLTIEQKKKFLLFLTGSDRMPILGIRAMKIIIQPMKVSEEHLPVAHTCFNVLDLPEVYSSEDKLRRKLLQAIEHIHVFTLA